MAMMHFTAIPATIRSTAAPETVSCSEPEAPWPAPATIFFYQLSAGDGDSVMTGEADNDSLTGGAGADALLGGTGNDTLTGGGGRDVFLFADNGAANADQILDYSSSDGDIVDLSAVLDSHFGPADNPADFARVIQSGSNVIVQVDADGTGVNWTDVATLNGYGTSGVDLVNVLFAGTVHQFTT
jgi:Ca2+-binding RTX toxin-like protein